MWRKFTIGLAAIALLGLGACKSSNGEKKDEKATEQKKQESKEESGEHSHSGDEHPGDEAGEEHPGDEAGEEHPGDEHPGEGEEHPGEGEEHPGDEAHKGVSASDIKKAMKAHIEKRTKEGDGVFKIKDKKADEKLELKFVKIHDPVRKMPKKGYFACTDFHVKGNDKKVYDLDFWLSKKDGKLKVTKEKIHKHPKKKDGKWTKKARYTFKNDEIVKVD